MLTHKELESRLPHRDPMLLVGKAEKIEKKPVSPGFGAGRGKKCGGGAIIFAGGGKNG